jgi:hypothetical protein
LSPHASDPQATPAAGDELPDELAAIRALDRASLTDPHDRAARATRSATLFLEQRRRRLRQELDADADGAGPVRRSRSRS